MSNQIQIVAPLAGQATDENVPLSLIKVRLGDGKEIGAVPVCLTGGGTWAMLDESLKGTFRWDISVFDGLAFWE